MHGWRNRIGVIVTSDDTTVESEFNSVLPEGVSVHASRMRSTPGVSTTNELREMQNDVERCAELLATAEVDVIAYCCTTGSLIEGPGYERELEDKITSLTGIPSITTSRAIKEAFEELNVSSLTVTTPYLEEINAREREYLEESGYEVRSIDGFRLGSPPESYTKAWPQRAYREARESIDPHADAIFISCTGYRTFEVIDLLERDANMPVITSNQATLWSALREAGVEIETDSLGKLFKSL